MTVNCERPLDRIPSFKRGGSATMTRLSKPTRLVHVDGCDRIGERLGVVLGIDRVVTDLAEYPVNPGAGFYLPFVRARLEWSLGEAGFEVICDWRLGTQVAVVADKITVTAEYDLVNTTDTEDDVPDPFPSFAVSAGVGYGGPAGNAQYTAIVNIAGALGATELVPVPAFARSFSVVPQSVVEVRGAIVFYGDAGATSFEQDAPITAAEPVREIPLPNGARHLSLKNNNALGGRALVVFHLAL